MREIKNIWGENPKETFFRKGFFLEKIPKEAFARIFADTGFEFFINGRYVAWADEWGNTRDYAIEKFLKKGKNIVAVHGINHGGHRAMAFELTTDGKSLFTSDESWLFENHEKWGWTEEKFDDSKWKKVKVLDMSAAGYPQWWTMPGSDRKEVIYPLRSSLFFNKEIPKTCDSPYYTKEKADFMPNKEVAMLLGDDYVSYATSDDLPEIVCFEKLIGAEKIEKNGSVYIDKTERYTGPTFIVDLGKYAVGHFRMRIESEKSVSFRLSYGETLDMVMLEEARDARQHDMVNETYRIFSGVQEFESRMRVEERYIKIEFFDCEAPVTASDFSIRTTLYPVEKRGYFKCSDEKINTLWEMGERTMHFCMQEYYLDAPRRDRLLWTGDARLEGFYNYYLFADTELLEYCLEKIGECQYPNGAVPSSYGVGLSILWDYVAWFVIAFYDYYMYTGKTELILDNIEKIQKAADYLISLSSDDGFIDVPKNPLGNLWMVELNEFVGRDPYLNDLYLRALDSAACLSGLNDDDEAVKKYLACADRIRTQVQIWRKDHEIEKTYDKTFHVQIQYEMAELYLKQGDIDTMMKRLNEHWAVMVENGADCMRECGYKEDETVLRIDECNNLPEYATLSYCHGWTAAASSLLPMGIAGIKPTSPGFNTVEIKPCLSYFDKFLCAVPTPHGDIAVKWENNEFSYYLPDGITANLFIDGVMTVVSGSGKMKK